MEDDIYIEVAIPIAQFKTFTYKIKKKIYENLQNKELIGRRVLVPFKKTGFSGIITKLVEKPDYNVKDIEEIPDKEPVFNQDYIHILEKLSDYYVTPIGMTVIFFMPDVLNWKKKNGKWIRSVKEEKIYIPLVLSTTGIEKLSQKSLELLEFILERGEVSIKEIKEFGFPISSLRTLLKKKLIKEERFLFKEEAITLKQEVHDYLKPAKIPEGFYIYTGTKAKKRFEKLSSIIFSAVKQGKGVILIYPNVKAVQFAYNKLKTILGDKVFIYHDGISGKEKIKIWFSLKKLTGCVVVGTYSVSLLPVKNLGVIILEEEPSDSYKILRTPRFDTRRIVYEVAKQTKSSLILASTIPSVEGYFLLKKRRFKNLNNSSNFFNKKQLEISPLNREKLFTKSLLDNIKAFDKVLIIANKKAYASFLYCKRCDQELTCIDCDTPLKVYSKPEKFLKCELCGQRYKYIERCTECNFKLEEIGFGIERIEEILNRFFPENISYLEEEKNTKIKLSTNILDKEILIPDFDLIVNVYPDFLLNINDFRGNETFFRNIITGYIKAKKKYVLITNNLNSEAVLSLKNRDLKIFYTDELNTRKEFQLPPYSKLILLTFEKKSLSISKVNTIFEDWIKKENIKNIDYKGAFYAYYPYIKGKNRIQILLKNFKEKEKLKTLYENCSAKGIKLIIDVDPKHII